MDPGLAGTGKPGPTAGETRTAAPGLAQLSRRGVVELT